jgi:hypothetical protein
MVLILYPKLTFLAFRAYFLEPPPQVYSILPIIRTVRVPVQQYIAMYCRTGPCIIGRTEYITKGKTIKNLNIKNCNKFFCTHSRIRIALNPKTTRKWPCYVLPLIKNWCPFCSEYLQRICIMYQNVFSRMTFLLF